MCDIMPTHTRHSLLRKGLLISGTYRYSLLYCVWTLHISFYELISAQQRANSSDISRWRNTGNYQLRIILHTVQSRSCVAAED